MLNMVRLCPLRNLSRRGLAIHPQTPPQAALTAAAKSFVHGDKSHVSRAIFDPFARWRPVS
jgi:hypothetical protein